MCKFKLFSIAAAALMMVACSNEDLTQQTQTKAGKMQFSATIAASSSGATTRTIYTEDTQNKKITVAWKVDDEIALIHDGVKDVATVKTVNDDGSATITGFITKADNGDGVEVCYPAALWDWDDNTKGAIRNATFIGNITKQDGTLNYIQDNLDVRMGEGELEVDGDKVTLNADVKLESHIAIWKLNLQDNATPTPAALSATQVKIKGGESVLASTTTLTAGTSVVTLAIPTYVFIDGALTIEATVGSDTYAYTKAEGPTFNQGTYYQSTVTMAKVVDPAKAYLKWDDGQKTLVATEIPAGATMVANANQDVNWAAGTYVVEGDVEINANITLSGNVDLIIKDGAKLTVNSYINGPNNNLSIYGQANQTGQLVVNSTDDAISNINTLEVHSCQVTATSSSNDCGGFFGIVTFNVYGGSVDAENTSTKGYGILLNEDGSMNIYGGEVKAVGKGTDSSYSYGIVGDDSSVTVYGGKLWAECAGNKALYSNVTLTKGAGFTGTIETSSDGSSWTEYTTTGTPDAQYVRVGY